MCGIGGIISDDHTKIAAGLARMNSVQQHRGPDDNGGLIVPFGRTLLGLCHQRLAIMDLGSTARQPMVDQQSGSILIYNGEIYNYRTLRHTLEQIGRRFYGHGDTEVLLAALCEWGPECLSKLEGMYAFAFYDKPGERVLLARDPLGIKPLHWTPGYSHLVFASEVRGIVGSGIVANDLDAAGVASLLAYGAFQESLTAYKDVKAFPPGKWAEVGPGERATHRIAAPRSHWWFPPVREVTLDEAIALTRAVLVRSVQSHLMSDVPLGVFLSSGIDSTIVAALAASHVPAPKAFTVTFGDNADYSEADLARSTARRLDLDHVQINVTESHALTEVEAWIEALDQPTLDGLNTFVVSKAVRKEGIVVALSGQGGDELFGGYPSFRDLPHLLQLLGIINRFPGHLQKGIVAALLYGGGSAFREKLSDALSETNTLQELYLVRRRLMSNAAMTKLGYSPTEYGFNYLPERNELECLVDDDILASISRLELKHYLANTLMYVGDISGMANSLEIRVPMLDKEMLDVICALPGSVRLPRRGLGKTLLRKAFAAEIGPVLSRQPKRGFVFPVARWMRGPLRAYCENALNTLKRSGVCEPSAVELVWHSYLNAPETQSWSRAWVLCVLGAWIQRTSPILNSELKGLHQQLGFQSNRQSAAPLNCM